MRNLTFKGFITQHVKELSVGNTISVFKLAKEASTTNPKLVEPLLLYAVTCGKAEILLAATKKTALNEKYQKTIDKYLAEVNENALQESVPNMPHGYKAIYNSFVDAKSKNRANDPSKEYYKKEIERISKENDLSLSLLAKKTGFKRGNTYKFFSNNQQDCLSINALKTMLAYLKKNYSSIKGDD